ncbi:MAG: single-stranded DNA-binding protein [Elusimicrobiota bacterium]
MKDIRLPEQNLVLISGYLARDPDVRFTQKGTAICHFTVGVTRRFKDNASGEWKDDTAWVPVDLFGEAADRLKDKLKKGCPVHVEGRLRNREYEDKTGNTRKVLDVVARRVQFLAKLPAGGGETPQPGGGGAKADPDLEEVPF